MAEDPDNLAADLEAGPDVEAMTTAVRSQIAAINSAGAAAAAIADEKIALMNAGIETAGAAYEQRLTEASANITAQAAAAATRIAQGQQDLDTAEQNAGDLDPSALPQINPMLATVPAVDNSLADCTAADVNLAFAAALTQVQALRDELEVQLGKVKMALEKITSYGQAINSTLSPTDDTEMLKTSLINELQGLLGL